MKALALLAGCALLGWWLVRQTLAAADRDCDLREAWEEQQRAAQRVRENQQRFLRDLAPDLGPFEWHPAHESVEVEVHELGVFVRSTNPALVIEVVTHNPAFYARVA